MVTGPLGNTLADEGISAIASSLRKALNLTLLDLNGAARGRLSSNSVTFPQRPIFVPTAQRRSRRLFHGVP